MFFSQTRVPAIERAVRATGAVDAVAPAIIAPVALQNTRSRRTEARVSLYAGRGRLRRRSASTPWRPARVYLNRTRPRSSPPAPATRCECSPAPARPPCAWPAIVAHDGNGGDGAAVMLPLARAQTLLGVEGQVRYVLVSNRGDETSGAALTDRVRASRSPPGLELQDVKRDGLELADQQGDVFMSIFTTFGSFSIVAGVLLIFLIFVMLSAERRTELGIARADRHAPRARRRRCSSSKASPMTSARPRSVRRSASPSRSGWSRCWRARWARPSSSSCASSRPRSLVIAYALGVLLTFVVVALSAWRVSVLNIVAAVRGMPEPVAAAAAAGASGSA